MAEQLKNDTHRSHQDLEGVLIPVIKNIFTVSDYATLLKMLYGYYKPLEDAISLFPVSLDLPDYAERRKAQLILNDLQAFNENTDTPVCSSVPAIGTIEEAYGALYVLEGSTLGGLIITKILQSNLQLTPVKGFTFFSGYGPETSSKWSIFKQVLTTYCNKPELYPRLLQSAEQTFIQLRNWAQLTYSYERAKKKL